MEIPVKNGIEDLAIFGGAPAFAEPLHVGRPNVGDRASLMERINIILDRNWLTNNGEFVREFERRVAESVGARHCIAMCNGTIALEIASVNWLSTSHACATNAQSLCWRSCGVMRT